MCPHASRSRIAQTQTACFLQRTYIARTVHAQGCTLQCTLQATKCCKYQGIRTFLGNFPPKKIMLQVVSSTAATFYVYTSFWSVLRRQALETPQLSFCNLHALKSCWPWPGSAPKPPKSSSKPCWAWPGWKSFPDLLRNPVEPDLALQSLPDLLRNLLRNPVEPDLALHQSLPDLHRKLLHNPVEAELALHQSLPTGTFSGIFSGTLLNLTWLCTKASAPDSSPEPSWESSPEPCWTSPGSAPKPPKPSPEPSPQPSPEPCWPDNRRRLLDLLWNLSETLPRNSEETYLALHQSLPDLLWNLPPNLLQNPVVCTKASQTFSGTFGAFSGTSLNLTPHLHQCTPWLF